MVQALLKLLLLAPVAATASKPNMIFFMADDMGWGEVGIYPAGSEHGRIATPNLDAFGKEGIQFTNAYTGYTVCAPSRTTLYTGRHSGQFVKYGLSGTEIKKGDKKHTTFAQLLKGVGYQTALFGKSAPVDAPLEKGFDIFLGQTDQAACHNMYPHMIDEGTGINNFNLTLNWKERSRDACMADPAAYNFTVDVTHYNSLEWIEEAAGKKDPFFLYMAFTTPHAGGWLDNEDESGAPSPTDGDYTNQTWPDVERDHAGVITYLDGLFGRLMAKLKELKIDDNTIVFFASDNGAHLEGGHSHKFFNSTGGLSGHKRSLYEGGVRTPTMVRWPGTIKPQISDFAWAFWDFLPTAAELAGVAEADIPEGIDGVSIVPTLLGKVQPDHDYLYWTWRGLGPEADSAKNPSGYSVRVGEWKGVVASCADVTGLHPSEADDMLLFNLANDPFEQTDVATTHKQKVEDLKKLVISKNLTCTCYQC